MGWTDSHMHEFLFRGERYSPTDVEPDVAEGINERKVRLWLCGLKRSRSRDKNRRINRRFFGMRFVIR